MKFFFYSIGILAQTGISFLVFAMLWVFTNFDLVAILGVDVIISYFTSIMMFIKIEEVEKRIRRNRI